MEIKRIEIDNDKIALKKSFDGWRVVYPYKNEDGTLNWKNIIGNKWSWIKIILLLLLISAVTYSYMHDTKACFNLMKTISENPLEFCKGITQSITNYTVPIINTTNIKFK
jgi:hypothetical protein